MSAAARWVTLGVRDSTKSHIKTALVEDRREGTFTDIVFSCKDKKTVNVHKLLLVASSKLLANILGYIDNCDENPVIILPDFENKIIVRLVAALYGDGDHDWDSSLEEAWKTLGLNPTSNDTRIECILPASDDNQVF